MVRKKKIVLPKYPTLEWEKPLWDRGIKLVAGIDEAGRGSLAGPVSAAALILPELPDLVEQLSGVRDSKKLTFKSREKWKRELIDICVSSAVGFSSNIEIDEIGIMPATYRAINRAIDKLEMEPQHLLVDYINIPDIKIPQTSIVRGDVHSLSIAGASILAKTYRDELMFEFSRTYPGYGFENNKGYGTEAHRAALAELGPSPIHRKCFNIFGLKR